MLKNYFRVALRSFKKNYVYTFINILGITVGLSGTIVTLLMFDYEKGFDSNFRDTSNIYRVYCLRNIDNESRRWGVVPNPLGPFAVDEVDEIETFCRYGNTSMFLVQHEDIIHRESVAYADPNFLDLFPMPTRSGSLSTFRDKSSVIISEALAKKYFGDEDPVGKQFTFRQNNKIFRQFKIGAVLKKVPKNSSFQFDLLIQHENIVDAYETDEYDWSSKLKTVLYVQGKDQIDKATLAKSLQKYATINNDINDSWKISGFFIDKFAEQKDEARTISAFRTARGLPISALYGSIVMNGLILLIACFNFTNTSLVYAGKRLREIGVRRTFGGYRWQIFKQFFIENFILCLVALLISVELANTWIRMLNQQWPIDIERFFFNRLDISLYLVIILLSVAIIAGAYPAYYASKFQPTEVLMGKVKLVGSNKLSRVLLTWQFGFSIMAIFCGIVLSQNAVYQRSLDWGFDKENALIVPLNGDAKYTSLKNAIAQHDKVEAISGTIQNIGRGTESCKMELDGVAHDARKISVGNTYLQTIGCKLVAGRFFHEDSKMDQNESIVVNQKFVETFNIDNPLKQKIYQNGSTYQIVGIIKDFMPYGLFAPIQPVMINAVPEEQYSNLIVKSRNQYLQGLMTKTSEQWKSLYPNIPFEGFFIDEITYETYNTNNGILVQFSLMAIFALILSVTGLYSIVSLNINKRVKEIGIRKVFGASVGQIMKIIQAEFSIILGIAVIIGCIGGFYFMDKFLSDIFTYYQPIGASSFILSSAVILLLTATTSGIKIFKAAQQNPSKSLKYE